MMKSSYIKVLLLSLLALTMGCRKEMDIPSSAPEVQTVHYMATVQAGVDTRATLGDGLQYEFEAGDRIYMESEDGKLYGFLSLSSDGGIGKNTALFEGDLSYVGEEPFQNNNPSVSLVLVSQNDELHTITDGKVMAVESGSYLSTKWATTLEEAVSHYSHFTGAGNLNDMRFTLQQQSSFLKCFVRMNKVEQAPVNRDISVQLLNNDVLLREATIKVTTAGSVPFVFAFLGDAVSLENAKLHLDWVEPGIGARERDFDVTNKTLAANHYYSISRSTLAFDGFRIRAISNSTTITFNYNYENDGIEYSLDFGETWNQYTEPFTLNKGDIACIRGKRTNYKNGGADYDGPKDKPIFKASLKCYISGNIMSLVNDAQELSESAFQGAFSRGGTAVNTIDIDPDAPLILPATTLASQCYMNMFRNCTSLTRAPQFRVEGAAYRCCYNMFRLCSGLKDIGEIELPAMTLAEDCYREMFRQCTSLTSVDSDMLPATSLAVACYQQMFNGCSKLTNSPDLPATTLADHCYDTMFSACSQLTDAPELRATTLVSYCYYQMFHSCSVLTEIRCRATGGIGANNSTTDWVKNINTTGTFYKAEGASWSKGNSGYPSKWSLVDLP